MKKNPAAVKQDTGMGLSYHFTFSGPASGGAEELVSS
jgi:hypothetical protein